MSALLELAERAPSDFDDLDDTCWNCGGEGVTYSCLSDYACINPEDGCDLCERRCDVCRPALRSAMSPHKDELRSE